MDRVLSGAALEMKTRCIEMTPFYHCKKAELPDTKGGAPIRATVGNAPTALLRLCELMEGGLQKIKERGRAQAGDKTMVDALEPAVACMKACAGSGNLRLMLDQAAQAAQEGMEATKNYQAKYGRAKSLMERALGHQDAGATSTWIIFRSMAEYVQRL